MQTWRGEARNTQGCALRAHLLALLSPPYLYGSRRRARIKQLDGLLLAQGTELLEKWRFFVTTMFTLQSPGSVVPCFREHRMRSLHCMICPNLHISCAQ